MTCAEVFVPKFIRAEVRLPEGQPPEYQVFEKLEIEKLLLKLIGEISNLEIK